MHGQYTALVSGPITTPETQREPVRVLLADDHDVLRRALRGLLVSEGFLVIADVGDASSAIEQAQRTHPDIISMDLSMPGVHLPDTIQTLAGFAPVVVFTGLEPDDARVGAARQAGASSILSKQRPPDELVNELRVVVGAFGATAEPLTRREREVVERFASGLDIHQLAKELGVGVGTVRTHIRSSMRKLGARTRAEAVLRLGALPRLRGS